MTSLPDAWLKEYYKYCYPVNSVFKWLSYGKPPTEYLQNREIAFILEGDVHIRFLTFTDPAKFKLKLEERLPHKIDFGAVYNHPCDQRHSFPDFKPESRELIFDIDLDEYDNIRRCCSDKSVCQKCWRFISIAVQVLDKILRDHFNFTKLLWLFSGRRGIHCWVADEVARNLDNSGRTAVVTYLSLIGSKSFELDPKSEFTHPLIDDAYEAIMNSGEIERLVIEQGWLNTAESWDPILQRCTDTSMQLKLKELFGDPKVTNAGARWKLMKRLLDINSLDKDVQRPSKSAISFFKSWVIEYAYPRLDVNVSTGTNHLLKSPFCIHPKTGNVAVPLNPKNIGSVKIDEFPTLERLIVELKGIKDEENQHLFYQKTSLYPYIRTFDNFVSSAISG